MEDNVLKVMIWGMEAGRLYWNKERKRAYFTYNQDFLSKGLDIAPLTASIYAPLSQRGLGHAGNTDKLYHCLTINGKDDDITDSDLIEFAKSNGIKGADNILSEVKTAISNFPNYAEAANIDKKWIECILSYIHINQSKL